MHYKKNFFQTRTNWTHFIIRYGNVTLFTFSPIPSWISGRQTPNSPRTILEQGILEQMEAEGQDTTEALIKRGMGISAAPERYQPAPPRYIRAGENSEDEEDGQDEEEDLEALYLAPKSALPSGPAQSEESAQIPAAGDQILAKDLSDLDLSEPMPELIDLREEGEKPSLFPPRKPNVPPS